MDGNTTVTFGLIAVVIGAALGMFGYMANIKSKAKHEGIVEGTIQTTMKNIETKIDNLILSNQSWQEKHSDEHKTIDKRLRQVEDFILTQDAKPKRRIKSIET